MQLAQPDRREPGRDAAFIAVVGLHVVAMLLFLSANKFHIHVKHGHDGPLALLSLAPSRPVALEAAPSRATKAMDRNPDAQPTIAPTPSNSITLPLRDWNADAQADARQADEMAEDGRRRNLAGPSVSQLDWWKSNAPAAGEPHKLGSTERAEGEVITWQGAKCYWTTRGVTTDGMPQTAKVCKDPFKPDTEMFKDMRKKLNEGDAQGAP